MRVPAGMQAYGSPQLGRDRGDDRLRAVPAGHGQPVRAALDGGADQRLEVVTTLQFDGLEATAAGLLGQREALGFAATGLRVVEEHRSLRRRCARQIHMDGEGGPGRSQRHQQPGDDKQIDQRRTPGDDQDQRRGQREAGHDQPDDPRQPAPQDPVPGGRAGDQHTAEQEQPARKLSDRDRERERRRGYGRQQRDNGQQPPSHRTILGAAIAAGIIQIG